MRLSRLGHFFYIQRMGHWVAYVEKRSTLLVDEEQASEVQLAKAATFALRGRIQLALTILKQLLPFARISGNRALLARVLAVTGVAYAVHPDNEKSRQLTGEAIALLGDRLDDTFCAGAHLTYVSVHATLGELSRAVELAQVFLRRARATGNPALESMACCALGYVALQQRDWQAAADASWEGVRVGQKAGHRLYEYLNTCHYGWAVAYLGDVNGGLSLLRRSIEMATQLRIRLPLGRIYGWLGDVLVMAGELDEAERAVSKGLRISLRDGYRVGVPLDHMVVGRIRAVRGERAEAETLLTQALEGYRSFGVRPQVAQCHALLAQSARFAEERRANWEAAVIQRARHRRRAVGKVRVSDG